VKYHCLITEICNFAGVPTATPLHSTSGTTNPATYCDKTGLHHPEEVNCKTKAHSSAFAYSIPQEAVPAERAEQLENITYSRAWRQKKTVRIEAQTYGYSPIMILHIVLVIVTAVQVNSQQLCPSVCQCNGYSAICKNLFSNVTAMTKHRFHSGLRVLEVTGSTRLELEDDLFLRWNITSLTSLDLSRNNITKIWQRAFYSLSPLLLLSLSENSITDIHPSTFQENIKLRFMYMNINKITSLNPELFKYNVELEVVHVAHNRITNIHPSTFRNTRRLNNVNFSGNKLISIEPETFNQNWELFFLFLSNNTITDIYPSTFRNNSSLITLDISRNKITSLNPDTLIHNKNLTFLYLQGNNITEISNSSFRGLENLEVLDLSNNNIDELNPLVFHNSLTSTNGQNQVSKLKYLDLAQNMIRYFNFELYFPISSSSESSTPTFQLEYLNLRSNRLTTLDVASMKWLNQTTAITQLSANPWNCDCSVLLEVWQGLKHKLTLHCASPRQLQGKSWDFMEVFCSQASEDKPNKFLP